MTTIDVSSLKDGDVEELVFVEQLGIPKKYDFSDKVTLASMVPHLSMIKYKA